MVDGIIAKPIAGGETRVAPVARAAATIAPEPVTRELAPSPARLAQAMAASPPVDGTRVAQIKAALAKGTFPILPATVADRLMALRYEWNRDEQA